MPGEVLASLQTRLENLAPSEFETFNEEAKALGPEERELLDNAIAEHVETNPTITGVLSDTYLEKHLTETVTTGERRYFEDDSVNSLAEAFTNTFNAEASSLNLGFEVEAIPINDPLLAELAVRTVSLDARAKVPAPDRHPLAIHGISRGNQDRSAAAFLIVGRFPSNGGEVVKPIGTRNLILASRNDIEDSFALRVKEDGSLSKHPYENPDEGRVLIRGWTFLFPDMEGYKVTGQGLGKVMEKATVAFAQEAATFLPAVIMLGETRGFIPENIMAQLIDMAGNTGSNIDRAEFHLFEIMGTKNVEEYVNFVQGVIEIDSKLEGERSNFERRLLNTVVAKLSLLGIDSLENALSSADNAFGIRNLLGRENPYSASMRIRAEEIGNLDPHEDVFSCLSCGVTLSGGRVYSGPVSN